MAYPRFISDNGATETWEGPNGQQLAIAKGLVPQAWQDQHLPAAAAVPKYEPPAPEAVSGDAPDVGGLGATPPGAPGLVPPPPPAATVPAPPDVAPSPQAQATPAPDAPVVQPPEQAAPLAPADVAQGAAAPGQAPPAAGAPPSQPRGLHRMMAAEQQLADVQAQRAENVAEAMAEGEREVADIEKRATEKRAADEQDIEFRREQKRAAIEKYNEHEVDRGNWWHSRDTGQKVMAAIGVALSGLGMALKGRGGENPALDLIMSEIDKDVSLQMAERDKMKEGIAFAEGEIQGAIGDASRRAAQMAELRAQRIDGVQREVAQIVQRTRKDEIRLSGQRTIGQLEEQKRAQIEESVRYEREADRADAAFEHQKQMDRGRLGLQWAEHKRKKAADEANAAAAAAKAGAPSLKGTIFDPNNSDSQIAKLTGIPDKEVAELRGAMAGNAAFNRKMDELVELVKKSGGRWDMLDFTERRKAETLRNELIGLKVKSISGAQATDKEREFYAQQFPGARAFFSADFSDQESVLSQTRRHTNSDLENKLNSYGIRTRDEGGEFAGGAGQYFSNLQKQAPAAQISQTDRDFYGLEKARGAEHVQVGGVPVGTMNPELGQKIARWGDDQEEQAAGVFRIARSALQGDDRDYKRLKELARAGNKQVSEFVRSEAQRQLKGVERYRSLPGPR